MSRSIEESRYARMIVVGDLHGYPEPLERLLDKIEVRDEDLVVFIGDYVDRGPDSKSLVEMLIGFASRKGETVFLKGNHEDMLLGAIGMPAVIRDMNTWLYNGGYETLRSYGMADREIARLRGIWDEEERGRRVLAHIPDGHVEFYRGLELYVETERYFICHAGVSPDATIEEGKVNVLDLLWTRDHFNGPEPAWEKTVVCGHTPQRRVLIGEKLICVDTGLYYFGTLSAIDLLSLEVYQVERTD